MLFVLEAQEVFFDHWLSDETKEEVETHGKVVLDDSQVPPITASTLTLSLTSLLVDPIPTTHDLRHPNSAG